MAKIRNIVAAACALALAFALAGCGGGAAEQPAASSFGLENGTYTAAFNTDSSMFHVNEANDGKGVLTVSDDGASIHVSLVSKKIVNLYPGTAEEAQAEGAELLQPTTDTVTYSDGTQEDVYGFDIPVPALDEEFDCAILGESGKWFDHKVSVSVPEAEGDAPQSQAGDDDDKEATAQAPAGEGDDDAAAAAKVAALIDAIYVQARTDATDAQCKEAKAAWDALTPEQQALVEGEYADPGYFGDDTGDASKDDPLNADGIGENEILVVSFGTSFNDSRVASIGAVEKAIQAAYPDWSVRRAFTAQIIINHIQARDGEVIDNVEQALARAEANGVKNLVVAPTHLMHGAEYDDVMSELDAYRDKMDIVVSEPLLGPVGSTDAETNADKRAVAEIATAAAVKDAEFGSLEEADEAGTAFVFMGHGTSHTAKVTYSQMQSQMEENGYQNVFVGTVEGEPEDTSCEAVLQKVQQKGYKNVVLRPLMVVAGDHANNDMADPDNPESWVSQFTAALAPASVDCQIVGLGEIPEIQQIYVEHVGAVLPQ